MNRPYPIVEYANMISKSTADLTTTDMVKFTKWWMKQPIRKDLLVTPKQRKEFNNDVKKVQKYFQENPKVAQEVQGIINKVTNKENYKMGKIIHKSKMVQTPVEVEEQEVFEDEDGNLVDAEGNFIDQQVEEVEETQEEEQVEEQQEEAQEDEEAVFQIGLTAKDVEALKWVIGQVFDDYDMSEHEYNKTLTDIKEVLDTV